MDESKLSTIERQFLAMMRACVRAGLSVTFVRDAAVREYEMGKIEPVKKGKNP